MRGLFEKVHAAWCVLTGQCEAPGFSLDELKDDDPVFASHMDWMEQRRELAVHRRFERTGNPIVDRLRGITGEEEPRA